MATIQEFQDYIRKTKCKALDQGVKILELSAESIHECVVGSSRGYTDIDVCRAAMETELGPEDVVLQPRNGRSMNLTIAYQI
ncbi:MAG: hypothetical protein ACXU8U_11445 [Asticcacaulis sp.]